MKKQSLALVILCGICAAIWTVRAILDLVYQTYQSTPWPMALNVLCAVVWLIAFVVNLNRYRSGQNKR